MVKNYIFGEKNTMGINHLFGETLEEKNQSCSGVPQAVLYVKTCRIYKFIHICTSSLLKPFVIAAHAKIDQTNFCLKINLKSYNLIHKIPPPWMF
jgi:hypothetical protein